MAATNQIFANSGLDLRQTYLDQPEWQDFVMNPQGAGGPGDQWTLRLIFRTVGSRAYVEGRTTVLPTSPAATPTSYIALTTINYRYKPAVDQNMHWLSVDQNGVVRAATLGIGANGSVLMIPNPSNVAFVVGSESHRCCGIFQLS